MYQLDGEEPMETLVQLPVSTTFPISSHFLIYPEKSFRPLKKETPVAPNKICNS
jgi:hypothetical protein